ncbi:hypothetical protein [Listeria booriae]|uniref:Conjugal transfer protein n=1 Tax=Listeria booriae TaxID=1552123 RepID=A0A7X1DSQ3_9LIST|nr:hypothetical protein [Listeria booriae]MBC1318491.1 hypothetical protein [Listeria booriae]MBC2373752.1 hypothetical protein [Listeria booriae]MBC2388800.1 hypothetical protein [Listeria booriae]
MAMPFDLTGFYDSFTKQLLIALAIAGAVMMIVGFVTQSWGKAIGTACGTIVIAGFVIIFKNLESIGTWFKNVTFKNAAISMIDMPHWTDYVPDTQSILSHVIHMLM